MKRRAIKEHRERGRAFVRCGREYCDSQSVEHLKGMWAMGGLMRSIRKALTRRGYSPNAQEIFWMTLRPILTPKPEDSPTEDMYRDILKNVDRYIQLAGLRP